jgi:hypothetical protein
VIATGASGKWSCPLCDMENDASDMNCVACEEPRPAELGGATSTQQAQSTT